MNFSILCGPQTQAATTGWLGQPAVLAALAAFTGVLITVIVGTVANFKLAKRRNEFERGLAQKRYDLDKELAEQKLNDERAARAATREENARFKHAEFQRTTLLELQEATHALLRVSSQIQLHDIQRSRDAGEWTKEAAPEEVSNEGRRLQAKTHLLASRAYDGAIRSKIIQIKRFCTGLTTARTEKESREALDNATIIFQSFNDEVGETLRNMHTPE